MEKTSRQEGAQREKDREYREKGQREGEKEKAAKTKKTKMRVEKSNRKNNECWSNSFILSWLWYF